MNVSELFSAHPKFGNFIMLFQHFILSESWTEQLLSNYKAAIYRQPHKWYHNSPTMVGRRKIHRKSYRAKITLNTFISQ